MNNTNKMQVAETTLAQLGGSSRLKAMLGARDFVGDTDSLTFKIGQNDKKVRAVQITLDPTDTYTVVTFNSRYAVKGEESNVSADSLRTVVESAIGMRLSL